MAYSQKKPTQKKTISWVRFSPQSKAIMLETAGTARVPAAAIASHVASVDTKKGEPHGLLRKYCNSLFRQQQ